VKAKAVIFSNIKKVETASFDITDPGSGQVMIETAYSCISPGTELRCLAGGEKNASSYPYIPGYSLSGEVIKAGEGVGIAVGTKVFARGTDVAGSFNISWGGHTGYAVCSVDDLVPLPEGVDLKSASLAGLAAISFHGVCLAAPKRAEKVIVLGLGIIGNISARIFSAYTDNVVACDLCEERVALAREAGINALVTTDNLLEEVKEIFKGGADIVVDATGIAAVMETAIALAKELPWDNKAEKGARFVVQGSYSDSIKIPYSPVFNKELNFLFPRDKKKKDCEEVLKLISTKKVNIENLITEVHNPDNAPECYRRLQEREKGLVTVAFAWE
jgi:3-hydroxyethyl bacteriochlorophyllide a dehydrogenase